MAVSNYKELDAHTNHKVAVVNYATQNVAIECQDCNEVLTDFDNSPAEQYAIYENTAWVSADGSYGTENIMTFDPNALTEEQWEQMDNLDDGTRMTFVVAVLDGEDLEEFGE